MRAICTTQRLAALAAGAMFLLTAPIANAADVDRGEALAEQWCISCHSIGVDEPRQEDAGPMFTELAERPPEEIVVALNTPHDFMPDFPSLSEDDKSNLAAYIKSLEE